VTPEQCLSRRRGQPVDLSNLTFFFSIIALRYDKTVAPLQASDAVNAQASNGGGVVTDVGYIGRPPPFPPFFIISSPIQGFLGSL